MAELGQTTRAVCNGSHEAETATCEQCGAEFRPRIKQGPNKSRFCKEACRNRYHRERREMNPLERSEPFSLTLANPNPKFRTRKDGDRWFIEFEVSADEAAYFTDPNINRKGMVIEAIHCEVAHLNPVVKESLTAAKDEKPKGGPLAELAGMWCKEPTFWVWINTLEATKYLLREGGVTSDADARLFILENCGIQSRRELDHNGMAKRLFEESIRKPFANYLARLGR